MLFVIKNKACSTFRGVCVCVFGNELKISWMAPLFALTHKDRQHTQACSEHPQACIQGDHQSFI